MVVSVFKGATLFLTMLCLQKFKIKLLKISFPEAVNILVVLRKYSTVFTNTIFFVTNKKAKHIIHIIYILYINGNTFQQSVM